jgi:hypothetical protein
MGKLYLTFREGAGVFPKKLPPHQKAGNLETMLNLNASYFLRINLEQCKINKLL